MQWRNAEREPTAPVDREYAVIRLDRADGTPLAVLFNYACHPVVMGGDNYQYSADYVGTASAVVEKDLKTTCLFLQGACGNINPYMDKTPQNQGGIEEMRQDGARAGRAADEDRQRHEDGRAGEALAALCGARSPCRACAGTCRIRKFAKC